MSVEYSDGYDYLQLKTYEELVKIELDVRPPLVTDERQPSSGSVLERLLKDVFGFFSGYFVFFILANLIRSAITKTKLYPIYWSFFGPYYFVSKAPLLTLKWNREAELLSDVASNQCLQSARSEHRECLERGESSFHCNTIKARDNARCMIYKECSDQSIEGMINFYIEYKPKAGISITNNILGIVKYVDPLAGVVDIIANDLIGDEYEPRTGKDRLNNTQIEQLHSQDCLLYLQALCLTPSGPLGLRTRGISYSDVDDYYKKYCKNLH